MSRAVRAYLQVTSFSGAVACGIHGSVEREKRMGVIPVPVALVGTLRDGMVGAFLGPFLAPIVFPYATLASASTASSTKKSVKCPFTEPPVLF
jgi:hypothetical protein